MTTFLLHGVTGGKTEVYIRAIEKAPNSISLFWFQKYLTPCDD